MKTHIHYLAVITVAAALALSGCNNPADPDPTTIPTLTPTVTQPAEPPISVPKVWKDAAGECFRSSGEKITCWNDDLGWWSFMHQCYLQPVNPQPVHSDPVWGGRTSGYIATCTDSGTTTQQWVGAPEEWTDWTDEQQAAVNLLFRSWEVQMAFIADASGDWTALYQVFTDGPAIDFQTHIEGLRAQNIVGFTDEWDMRDWRITNEMAAPGPGELPYYEIQVCETVSGHHSQDGEITTDVHPSTKGVYRVGKTDVGYLLAYYWEETAC